MKHFTKVACAMLLPGLLLSGIAQAQQFTMRIASGSASKGFLCETLFPKWGEKVKKESGGRIDYQIFCDGTLGKMGDTVNRVERGVAEVGWDIPSLYGARFSQLSMVALPGLDANSVNVAGAIWKTYESGAVPPIKGVKLITIFAFGRHGIWTTKPITDLTNLKGIKISSAGRKRSQLISNMGGIPVTLRTSENYQALSRGTVLGVFSPTAAVFDFSMTDMLKFKYDGNFGRGHTVLVMNQSWYNKLPDDLKKVVDQNTGYEATKAATLALVNYENSQLKKAVAAGVKVHTFTAKEAAAWKPAMDATIDAWLKSDPNNAKYLKAFRENVALESKK